MFPLYGYEDDDDDDIMTLQPVEGHDLPTDSLTQFYLSADQGEKSPSYLGTSQQFNSTVVVGVLGRNPTTNQ